MDTDDKLRSIFGNLRGGRLEDVADKLIALFREPEWWADRKIKSPFASAGAGAPTPPARHHGPLEAVGED